MAGILKMTTTEDNLLLYFCHCDLRNDSLNLYQWGKHFVCIEDILL
ncbi:hypothetical protein Fuma_01826 [Fuerstiella marisgermanici]|uniref:Uncharacterized protein n=1 Tax=Fuerstiella marisgermanici TaxID=1891926 RepID=A0A1P8WDW0_9PLAN|nr:hypothetical protein Fuma_01826 [Fuerstiella marisgermanici]